jgi:hypothetical protein
MLIKIDTITTIPAGVALKLTPEQAAARAYALEPYDIDGEASPGIFVGTVPLQFKIGESVEIAGNLPKGMVPAYDSLVDWLAVNNTDLSKPVNTRKPKKHKEAEIYHEPAQETAP